MMLEREFEKLAAELRKLTSRTVMVEVSPVPFVAVLEPGGEGEAAQLLNLTVDHVEESEPEKISLSVSASGNDVGEFHVCGWLVSGCKISDSCVRLQMGTTEVVFWDQETLGQ